jgi:Uma2 family endonuclease
MGGAVVETAMHPHYKLTVEDYQSFPDDGQRHELIDGEHVVTAAPSAHHQRVLLRLARALEDAAGGAGEVLVSPIDVTLSRHDVLQPDVLWVGPGRLALVQRGVDGPPDLAVEILSPSSVRTDELRKRQRYEVFGVAELWIVDPESEVVRVYRREGEGFGRPLQLSAERGERLESALLPALSLPLPGLFAPGPSGRR